MRNRQQYSNRRDFNTSLRSMDISFRQKINIGTLALNDMLYQIHPMYIYRIFPPKATKFKFFSSAHGTF